MADHDIEKHAGLAFLASQPRWRDDVVWRAVGPELVVWTPAESLVVGPPGAAFAPHLVGDATVADLVEDAVWAGMGSGSALSVVSGLTNTLHRHGAVDGIEPSTAVDADAGSASAPVEVGVATELDPTTAHEILVRTEVDGEGNVVRTELFPDGRRRVSTTVTLDTGPHRSEDRAPFDPMVDLLDGRSPAELVPVDSCLGFKLRTGEAVTTVALRSPDGVVSRVRVHPAAVAAAMVDAAGSIVVGGAEAHEAPVDALVVSALQGIGPPRIYDRRGERRGRPRTVADAVGVVDEVIGELWARRATRTGGAVVLHACLATSRDGIPHIVPTPVVDDLRWRRWMRDAGWCLDGTATIDAQGDVRAARAWRAAGTSSGSRLRVLGPGGLGLATPGAGVALITSASATRADRSAFDAAVDALASAPVVDPMPDGFADEFPLSR